MFKTILFKQLFQGVLQKEKTSMPIQLLVIVVTSK